MSTPASTPIKSTYTLSRRLQGHNELILCMAATSDGKLLASGGGDGTIIWSLDNMSICRRMSTHGGTTAITWIKRDGTEGLVYGTHDGYLVFCRPLNQTFEEAQCLEVPHASEVNSLVYDPTTNRLVVANREGVIGLFIIDPTEMTVDRKVWAVKVDESIPRALAFNSRLDVVVFGVHDGVYTLKGDDGSPDPDQMKELGVRIGDVAFDDSKSLYCVDNMLTGCALYRTSDHAQEQEFEVPREKKRASGKRVIFAESSKIVVSGSDHGKIYVFNLNPGVLQEIFDTKTSNWIQALTATSINGTEFIIAGEAGAEGQKSDIYVFKKKGPWFTNLIYQVLQHLALASQVLVYVGAVTAIYQNIEIFNATISAFLNWLFWFFMLFSGRR
ncbi:hypothetical protein VKT23_012624 [Stygiomarasmius scandens]|uniref:WD40 repeat-like protein n=1 Tax=Marasmiellus scandens TaxID=2682957 RepID=A0ABR1J910_9AGAR